MFTTSHLPVSVLTLAPFPPPPSPARAHRYYDTDKNMRLTSDELEAFFMHLFGEVTPKLKSAFDTCKYQSSATQGRDAGAKDSSFPTRLTRRHLRAPTHIPSSPLRLTL